MTLVRIVKNWDYPDLMLQTPAGAGIWNEIEFTLDPVQTCDALVVLNHTARPVKVKCPPQNVWALVQEPPIPEYRWLEKGFDAFARVYTPDVTLTDARYIHSHGALPWHVGKSYDFLKGCAVPQKSRSLSSIASRETGTAGKLARVNFLETLSRQVDIDLWGKGFTPIDEKWKALAPYRYALAIENYSGPHYWTEKISDCFLAWTMPIYYGATNITEYFPPESLVQIDINKPEEAISIIKEAVHSDLYRKNKDAIFHARELVLEKYQLFPFIVNIIKNAPNNGGQQTIYIPVNLRPNVRSTHLLSILKNKIRYLANKKIKEIF
jgi:hypothetical protein